MPGIKGQGALNGDDCATAMLAYGFAPQEPYPGSNFPWRCIHVPCGNAVSPRLSKVKGKPDGIHCRYCRYGSAGEKRMKASWDRAEAILAPLGYTDMLRIAAPRTARPSWNRPRLEGATPWGARFSAMTDNIIAGHLPGYPGGFKISLPGYLYLFDTNQDRLVFGISNNFAQRRKMYDRRGHHLLGLWESQNGSQVLNCESAIIRAAGKERPRGTSPGEVRESLFFQSAKMVTDLAESHGLNPTL